MEAAEEATLTSQRVSMRSKLKLVLLTSGSVGAAVELVEWLLWRFRVDSNWPPFLMDLELYLWPTQMFFAGSEAPGITEAPREHILSIFTMYVMACVPTVVLYCVVGVLGNFLLSGAVRVFRRQTTNL